MSNYTEADVKRDGRAVAWNFVRGENWRGDYIESGTVVHPPDALARLEAAALEGAKVPGLVEQVRTLTNRATLAEEQRTQTHRQVAEIAQVLDPEVTPDAWGCHEAAQKRMREVSALQARVAELMAKVKRTAEVIGSSPEELPDAAHALWEDADEQRTRAEASEVRVAELERRLSDEEEAKAQAMVTADHMADERDEAQSERDALRAQVDAYFTALDARQAFNGGGGGLRGAARERTLAKRETELIAARKALRAAISAPPAEPTPETGASVLYVLEVHAGSGEWEPAFLGTLASTVRENVNVKDRSMGSTRIAEYVRRPPAETTKAPISDAEWCARAAAREGDSDVVTGPPAETAPAPERAEDAPLMHCASDNDGHCTDRRCPQRTKRERYCALARADEADRE